MLLYTNVQIKPVFYPNGAVNKKNCQTWQTAIPIVTLSSAPLYTAVWVDVFRDLFCLRLLYAVRPSILLTTCSLRCVEGIQLVGLNLIKA